MCQRFSTDQIAAIKHRIKLSDIIGRSVKLFKRGNEFEALCPFHHENTPSFTVVDDDGYFHCFGCGENGDIFDWLDKKHGLPFVKAIRYLESESGMQLRNIELRPAEKKAIERRQREQVEEEEKKKRGAVGLWQYAAELKGSPAEDYLRWRLQGSGRYTGIGFERLGRYPGAIRYRPDVWHDFLRAEYPAMLTIMLDARDQPMAVHRTFLEHREGRWQKLQVVDDEATKRRRDKTGDKNAIVYHKGKLVLGKCKGGYMPLWKGECRKSLRKIDAGLPVHVGEGVEDGLSIAVIDPSRRVTAGYSLGNIGNFPMPPQAGDFILLWQNDKPDPKRDQQKENILAKQQVLAAEHADPQSGECRRVRMLQPEQRYNDWNDQLRDAPMVGV